MGGVHPEYSKLTAGKKIEEPELPERVVLPLQQHTGAPCDPMVEEGDHVKVGQKIADSESLSAPIHASVSGTVTGMSAELTPSGDEVESVIIESDGKDEWVEMEGLDPEESSREEIVEKVRESGIVGLGGATFPTHVKLSPPEEKDIDTLLINGAECEPYITADHQLMLEEGKKILEGARIIRRVLDAERIIVGVEDNKQDAIENLRELSSDDIEVVSLETRYPQGDEFHLIKAILDREIPKGGLPFDVGVGVQNVGTAKAIYDAVCEGVPLVERVTTVTGDVKEPKNLLPRLGTSFFSLIEECGGPEGTMRKMICGGPMMGTALSEDVPVTKGANCVLVFNESRVEEEEERVCIRCGKCIEACPLNLIPSKLQRLVRNEEFEACRDYDIMSCDDCGCCAYICPSKIPLVEIIRRGKEAVSSMGD